MSRQRKRTRIRGAAGPGGGTIAGRPPALPPGRAIAFLLFALDAALVSMARGGGAIDLAIGETLVLLSRGDRLAELGPSKLRDYLNGMAGIPPRTYYFFVDLANALADRPILRRAVVGGLVSPRKAMIVAPVAIAGDEAAWAAAAADSTEEELRLGVRTATGTAPEIDAFEIDVLEIRMNGTERTILDEAVAAAKWILGMDKPRWMCLQAIAMEWIGGFPEHVAAPVLPSPPGDVSARDVRRLGERWYGELSSRGRALEEQLCAVDDALDPGRGLTEEVEGLHGVAKAKALHSRLERLVAAKKEKDEPFGRLAALAREAGVAEALGFPGFDDYCRERLGMGPRTVRERIWLEGRMRAIPSLRRALVSGLLSYTKAVAVAREATPGNARERIARAAESTWQEVDRAAREREEERHRRRGRLLVRGPRDALEPLVAGIQAARAWSANQGVEIGPGAALALMACHFLSVWRKWIAGRRRSLTRLRKRVMLRRGGLCAVPHCSRAAVHAHHLRFRSRGGGDEEWNLVGVCWPCHERGIHRGRILARGRAGERMEWELGAGDGVRLEEWETLGPAEDRRTRTRVVTAG